MFLKRQNQFEGFRQLFPDELEATYFDAFSSIQGWSDSYGRQAPTVDDAVCKAHAEKVTALLHRHFLRNDSQEEVYSMLRSDHLRRLLATDLVCRFLCLHVYRTFGIKEPKVEMGLDFWLDEDLRTSLAKLENNIHSKSQSASLLFPPPRHTANASAQSTIQGRSSKTSGWTSCIPLPIDSTMTGGHLQPTFSPRASMKTSANGTTAARNRYNKGSTSSRTSFGPGTMALRGPFL